MDEVAAWIGAGAGLVGVVVATLAAVYAWRANRHAVQALEIERRSEERQTERHDVFWVGDWHAPGQYAVVNRGQDTAYDVVVLVDVDGEEIRKSVDQVPPGEPVAMDFPGARAELMRLRRKSRGRATNFPGPDIPAFALLENQCAIRERVTWVSERGVPHVYDEEFPMASFGDFDDD